MSNFKDRFVRAVRANLNDVLDRVKDFEKKGGFEKIFDTIGDDDWDDSSARHETSGRQADPDATSGDKTIREYYANLEVPYGADMERVKQSYRRLMRSYHPDRYANDSDMEELATELSQELTQAYHAVKRWHDTGRY
jgi:NADPH:quinone reductase-like Zn-dependent oxidoreductase